MDLVSLLTSTTSKGNPNAWDISKAYYDAGADAWNVSKAFVGPVLGVSARDTNPAGIYIKPDGTKLYVVGDDGNDINEYTLSIPWNISTASYVQNFSVSTQETNPQGIFFKPDGTKMYVIGYVGDDVNEYDLSTPWDISTASYLQNFSVSTQAGLPNSIFFKPDGTKFYVTGGTGTFYEYSVSTPWDISTSSFTQSKFLAQDSVLQGTAFSQDGTKLLTLGNTNDRVFEYSLSSAWDISTATYTTRSIDISIGGQELTPSGLFAKPDGSMFYVNGRNLDSIVQYIIGGFSVTTQEVSPTGLFFKPDGTKMYVIGVSGDDVNEYNLSSAWDITTASYVQVFYVGTQDLTPHGLFFKSDGLAAYVVGQANDSVYEYSLSSAWNVSTMSYVRSFSVSAQDLTPTDLFFKPDGTKMYVLGDTGNDVNEYSIGTAWNISTASYVQNFSVAGQETTPQGLFFKPDGTKMYIIGSIGDDINEYSLSSAWDVSSSSYIQTFSVKSEEGLPTSIFFKDDGTQFWIVGQAADKVFSYLISPT